MTRNSRSNGVTLGIAFAASLGLACFGALLSWVTPPGMAGLMVRSVPLAIAVAAVVKLFIVACDRRDAVDLAPPQPRRAAPPERPSPGTQTGVPKSADRPEPALTADVRGGWTVHRSSPPFSDTVCWMIRIGQGPLRSVSPWHGQ